MAGLKLPVAAHCFELHVLCTCLHVVVLRMRYDIRVEGEENSGGPGPPSNPPPPLGVGTVAWPKKQR